MPASVAVDVVTQAGFLRVPITVWPGEEAADRGSGPAVFLCLVNPAGELTPWWIFSEAQRLAQEIARAATEAMDAANPPALDLSGCVVPVTGPEAPAAADRPTPEG